MLVRVKNTVINTDQITAIKIHEDEKYMGSGKPSNFIMVHFSGEDKERVDFDSNEQLRMFLSKIEVN